MSDFKPIDELAATSRPQLKSLRSSSSNSSENNPILIPLNANANLGNECSGSDLATGQDPNGNQNPEEHGATSMKKRSKRPVVKPSPALLLAKQKALQKKSNLQPEIQVMMKDHLQPSRDAKDNIRKQTGLVYDLSMLEHRCLWDPNYPEKPERLSSVIFRCKELGLLARTKHIEPRSATPAEVLSIHTEEIISKLRTICESNPPDVDELERHASKYDGVYFHPSTYHLSLLAAGSTIELVDAVLSGTVQNGMAIIRPPGHHAMKSEYCGYCYFNNVAIAAQKALDTGTASRILVVDFDVHHGQATQQSFYNDPRVLYFSTHRYEHGMFWPNLEESDFNFIGASNGIGFNCNVPLNKTGMGNSDFLAVWHQLLLPMAYQFNPDLVIVSAGYDAALGCFEFSPDIVIVSAGFDSSLGDEKGEMEVTPAGYSHLISPLMGLANGKIAVVLEGGYCLKSLAEGAALTLKTLLGDSCPTIPASIPLTDALVDSVLSATYMLKAKWSFLIGQTHVTEGEEKAKTEQNLVHIPEVKFLWNTPLPEVFDTRNCYPVQSSAVFSELDERLNKLILTTDLKQPPNRVAYVYDDLMLKHRNAAEPGHPERPERISNIFACHADFGLFERCHKLKSREATEEELLLVHTEQHLRKMKGTQTMSNRDLHRFKENFNSIFFNNFSYQCALVSAGSVLQVVDSVIDGESRSGVAIVRPPGHHAETDEPCGFCLFNNVALAAKYALSNHGLKRVMILDWDVHHGNGIQHIFEDDPGVLYISLHRYDYGGFFPCSDDANYDKVGNRAGKGFNVNIPWNAKGMGDTEYLAAFLNVVMPIAYEYNPELVLVSAGFDAAKGDPLGGCKLTPEGYAHMTHLLSSLANGRVIVALEGGYNLTAIAYSMTMCTKALLGDPIPPLQLNDEIHPVAVDSIRDVLRVQSEYWSVLKPFRKHFPFNENQVVFGVYPEKPSVENLDSCFEKLTIQEKSKQSRSEFDLNLNPIEMEREANENADATAAGPAASSSKEEVNVQPINLTVTTTGATEDDANPLNEALQIMGECANEAVTGVVVSPKTNCPHLADIGPIPAEGIDVNAKCSDCENTGENWICLKCYTVYCSRYVNGHMVKHGEATGHKIALSFADLSVWCYECDDYIDHADCHPAKSAAHLSKFGKPL